MNRLAYLAKTEPAILLGALRALLGVLVAGQVLRLDDGQTDALLTATAAVLALVTGLSVRPFRWPLVVAVVETVAVALATFGLQDQQLSGALVVFTSALSAVLIREHVTPEIRLPAAVTADGAHVVTSVPAREDR